MNIMKKLLILFMVLAIASSVSAQPVVNFVIVDSTNPAGDYEGHPSYPISTILTIGLVQDPGTGIAQLNADILGPGAAQNPLTYPTGPSQGPAPWWSNPVMCSPGGFVNDGTTLIAGIVLMCQLNFADYVIPGTILYTFDYHVDGQESDIIEIGTRNVFMQDVMFGQTTEPIPSILIHVPEPVTIALLGLGGLFLRRRK